MFFKQINMQVPESNNEVNPNKKTFISEVDIKRLDYCNNTWET